MDNDFLDLFDMYAEFDAELSMDQACELLDFYSSECPMAYKGRGVFEPVTVLVRAGAEDFEIDDLTEFFNTLEVPEDLITLLRYTNGAILGGDVDSGELFTISEIIQMGNEYGAPSSGLLPFMSLNGDRFFISCSGDNTVYVSDEFKYNPADMDLTLPEFIDRVLITGFASFWRW